MNINEEDRFHSWRNYNEMPHKDDTKHRYNQIVSDIVDANYNYKGFFNENKEEKQKFTARDSILSQGLIPQMYNNYCNTIINNNNNYNYNCSYTKNNVFRELVNNTITRQDQDVDVGELEQKPLKTTRISHNNTTNRLSIIKQMLNNLYLILIITQFNHNLVHATPSQSSSPSALPVESIQISQQKCQPVNTELCNIDKYSTLQPFNNTLGHTSISSAIAELHKYAYLFNKEQCKRNIQLFLCSLYTPVCVDNQLIINNVLLPCRDICESAKLACLKHLKAAKEDWPLEWTCNKFKYYTEDKLCVINNTNDNNYNSDEAQLPNSQNSTTETQENDQDLSLGIGGSNPNDLLLSTTTTTPLKCSDDEFDCKLRDFHTKGMHLFCIDKSLVCDGRKDCLRNDTFGGLGLDEGLDEVNCEVKCSESELICDNKCIMKQDICNGFVDCSSGADEANCYDHVSGVIQSILMIFGLFLSIYILIQFFRLDSQKTTTATSEENFPNDNSHNNSMDKQHYTTTGIENYDRNHLQRENNPDDIIQSSMNLNGLRQTMNGIPNHHHHHVHRHALDQDEIDQHFSARNSVSSRFPIYQEPAYSIATRSDYERVNTGGYSGASSVCMYSAGGGLYQSSTTLPPMNQHHPHSIRCHYDYDNAPAPPPTPAIQSIYSTGSITKLADLYVNLNSPHKTDLLD